MKYVLDSCVAVKWYLPEPDSAKAQRLLADYQSSVHDLVSPAIMLVEFAHAMTRAERQGILAFGDADLHLVALMSAGIPLAAYEPLLRRAVAISSAVRMGVYDCIYVALAEREQCALVTADDKLIRNLQKQFPFITSLASIP